MVLENYKQNILDLVRQWRTCTGLKIERIIKLMQEDKDFGLHRLGKKMTRAIFEAKFIQKAEIHTHYDPAEIYALLAAFTKGYPVEQCCTAEEAILLCSWAGVPIERQWLEMLFGRPAVETAFQTVFMSQVTPENHWKLTGDMAEPRNLHGVALLHDGRVLVTGGISPERSGEPLVSTEIYTPKRETWSDVGNLNEARFWFSIALLHVGKVLVAGGTDDAQGEGLASAELYDALTGRWTLTGKLQQARRLAAYTLMADGRVFVAGGAHGLPNQDRYLNTAEIYDPLTEQWSPANSMAIARDNAKAVLLHDGNILIVGGETPDGYSQTAELYHPATEQWTMAGQLSLGRCNSSVTMLHDGRVLVAGGSSNADRKYHDTADLYNPETNTWTLATAMLTKRASHAGIVLPDNRVLVTGGINATGIQRSTELYDPDTDTWTPAVDMQKDRVGHWLVTLSSGEILAVGGLSSIPINSASGEFYTSENLHQ